MAESQDNAIIRVDDLWRSYRRGAETINACAGVSLAIARGDMVAIVGRSGSGKTTLLNQIGCLDSPSRGRIMIAGAEVTGLAENRLVVFRRKQIGFIFQLFYLIPTLTVWENVELPLVFSRQRSEKTVADALDRVGLLEQKDCLPAHLDGGSMQKVAIARALVNAPSILLADEPTGRLEARSKEVILGLLNRLWRDGLTVVIATHDLKLAEKCRRIIRLADGKIIEDRRTQ